MGSADVVWDRLSSDGGSCWLALWGRRRWFLIADLVRVEVPVRVGKPVFRLELRLPVIDCVRPAKCL